MQPASFNGFDGCNCFKPSRSTKAMPNHWLQENNQQLIIAIEAFAHSDLPAKGFNFGDNHWLPRVRLFNIKICTLLWHAVLIAVPMLKVLVINLNTMHTHQIDTFKLNSRLSPWSGQWEKQTFHSSYRAVAASTQVTSETDQHIKKLCKTDNCKRITYLRQLQPDKSMTLSDIRVKLIFGYSVTTSFRETWFKSVRATRSKIAHFCSIHLDIWSILEDLLDCIDLSQVTNNSWRCMSIDIVNLIDISPHHNFVS